MKKPAAIALFCLLAACATATPGGPRTDWICDGGAAYSVRITSAGAAEVFAAGQVHTLAESGGRYSDGTVIYSSNGTLTGARGGPYNNCRRG